MIWFAVFWRFLYSIISLKIQINIYSKLSHSWSDSEFSTPAAESAVQSVHPRIKIKSVDVIYHLAKLSKRDQVFFQDALERWKKSMFYSKYAASNLWEDLFPISRQISVHQDGSLCTASSTFHEEDTNITIIINITVTTTTTITNTNTTITIIIITTTIGWRVTPINVRIASEIKTLKTRWC